MPIDIATGIGVAANLASQGMNANAQTQANMQNFGESLYWYNRQRKDSLADWNMQNLYNSPIEQMKRLKAAGLNPNLIYGKVNMDTPNVRSSEPTKGQNQPVRYDFADVMNSIVAGQDIELKQAQTNNLKATNDNIRLQGLKIAADIEKIWSDVRLGDVNLKQKNLDYHKSDRLFQTAIDQAIANLHRTEANTQFTLSENERKTAMQSLNLRQAAENILLTRIRSAKTSQEVSNLKQQLINLKSDNRLKDYEVQLNKSGAQKGDSLYERLLMQFLSELIN